MGAEWNPSDTVNSGAVFYLIPPADRTRKWEAVRLPAEPTTHRMKWIRRGDNADGKPRYDLVVAPLHGRGNKNGEGVGVKVLAYQMPKNPKEEWKTEVVCDDMHMTHNFDVSELDLPTGVATSLDIAGREGIKSIFYRSGSNGADTSWIANHTNNSSLKGSGEARMSWGLIGKDKAGFGVAAVEPMHGTQLVFYPIIIDAQPRIVLDSTLEDGHALACGDLLGIGRDQIIVGWRAMQNKVAKVGIKMFVPDEEGQKWTQHLLDDNTMACEDLVLADLNGDGKLDIIASGRRTKNVKIYWNETK